MLDYLFNKFKSIFDEFKGFSIEWKAIVVLLVLLTIGSFVASGIFGISPEKSYIEANYSNAELAIPDLIAYIKSDLSLSEQSKVIRIKALEEWLSLNKLAKDNLDKK
mgnify:CR=1 FL=1